MLRIVWRAGVSNERCDYRNPSSILPFEMGGGSGIVNCLLFTAMAEEIVFFDEKKPEGTQSSESFSEVPGEKKDADGAMPTETSPETEKKSEKAELHFSNILSRVGATGSQQPSDAAAVATDAQGVAGMTDAESQVNELVQIATVKGIAHAVSVARKLNDFYVLDRMHDELAEKFYEALKAKGMIQEE